MPAQDTAEAQLRRILYLLPAAGRPEGAGLGELARALGITPKQVARDALAVLERAYYHPSGSALESAIELEPERVTVLTPAEFRRPLRLTAREAVALGLGLRVLAAEAAPGRAERMLALAERLERELALPAARPAHEAVGVSPGEGGGGELRGTLERAVRERSRCRIEYLKPGAAAPEPRVVHPYLLVYSERWWYLLGQCERAEAVRAFRLDRVLDAGAAGGSFLPPADFDPGAYLAGGRLFRAEEVVAVRVRYSARIARWLEERYPSAETRPGGGLVVTHAVADPAWLVGHVLQYGADAEVLDPPEARGWMRDALSMAAETSTE